MKCRNDDNAWKTYYLLQNLLQQEHSEAGCRLYHSTAELQRQTCFSESVPAWTAPPFGKQHFRPWDEDMPHVPRSLRLWVVVTHLFQEYLSSKNDTFRSISRCFLSQDFEIHHLRCLSIKSRTFFQASSWAAACGARWPPNTASTAGQIKHNSTTKCITLHCRTYSI